MKDLIDQTADIQCPSLFVGTRTLTGFEYNEPGTHVRWEGQRAGPHGFVAIGLLTVVRVHGQGPALRTAEETARAAQTALEEAQARLDKAKGDVNAAKVDADRVRAEEKAAVPFHPTPVQAKHIADLKNKLAHAEAKHASATRTAEIAALKEQIAAAEPAADH